MEQIKNKSFGGERPLFGAHDVRLEDITITDGESGIKCCKNIECHHSKFYGKYPWWHVDGSLITDCYFAPESRSAIWYSDNMALSLRLIIHDSNAVFNYYIHKLQYLKISCFSHFPSCPNSQLFFYALCYIVKSLSYSDEN